MSRKTIAASGIDYLKKFRDCLFDEKEKQRRIVVLTFETAREAEVFFKLKLQRISSEMIVQSIDLNGRRTVQSFEDLAHCVIEQVMGDVITAEEMHAIRIRDLNSKLDEISVIDMMLICSDHPRYPVIENIPPAVWKQFVTPERFKFVLLIPWSFGVAFHCAAQLGESAMLLQMTSEGFERINIPLSDNPDADVRLPLRSATRHTGVQIVRVQNSATLDEMMADSVLGSLIVYRLSPTDAAVMPGCMTDVERRLKVLGHHPQR